MELIKGLMFALVLSSLMWHGIFKLLGGLKSEPYNNNDIY